MRQKKNDWKREKASESCLLQTDFQSQLDAVRGHITPTKARDTQNKWYLS